MKPIQNNQCATIIVAVSIIICVSYVDGWASPLGINVKKGVAQFLHRCAGNSTMRRTVSAATLCVENGVAQISGRNFRSTEGITDSCRVFTSVLHCLQPLKSDLEICSGKEEIALLDLLDEFCQANGEKSTEFQEILGCVRADRKTFETCFESAGGRKYTQTALGNPCDAVSVLEKCTNETLDVCKVTNAAVLFRNFLTNLEQSNSNGYKCITRISKQKEMTTNSSKCYSGSFVLSLFSFLTLAI